MFCGGFSAERGLGRVAPCAAVDVALRCVSMLGVWFAMSGGRTLSILTSQGRILREVVGAICRAFEGGSSRRCMVLRVCAWGTRWMSCFTRM